MLLPHTKNEIGPHGSRAKAAGLPRTLLSVGGAICLLLVAFGCTDHQKTLAGVLQHSEGERIVLVERLEIDSHDGLLSTAQLRDAKALQRIDQAKSLESLSKIFANAQLGLGIDSHPVNCGEWILRVFLPRDVFYVFCNLEKTEKRTYGVLWMGSTGETNRNYMRMYESDSIPRWLDDNGLLGAGMIRIDR